MNKILIITLGIFFIFISNVSSDEDRIKNAGFVTSISECRHGSWGDYDECIVTNYSKGTLHIEHQNAVYNCCFKDIYADIKIVFNKIYITSYEKEARCA